MIIEKPFGNDLASARALNTIVLDAFDESMVYRIDHYLGKKPVHNMVVFRFAYAFIEPFWIRNHIESIQITMAEDFGVQGRGTFYDRDRDHPRCGPKPPFRGSLQSLHGTSGAHGQ